MLVAALVFLLPAVLFQRELRLYYRVDDSSAAANGDEGNGDADQR